MTLTDLPPQAPQTAVVDAAVDSAADAPVDSRAAVPQVDPELLDWFSHDLLIAGAHRPASDGGRITVCDPADGSVLATVASATVDDGLAAVAAAEAALPVWAATPPRERAEVLRRAYRLMVRHGEDLARLIVRENGKALADARGEVAYAAEFFRWYAEEAVRVVGSVQTSPAGGHRILVTHKPVGVSLLVTPWNFPAAMATRKIGPALAAGCPVILKPASETPLTALAVVALLGQAGVPAGVVNVLPSQQSGPLCAAVLAHPAVRKLSFTGSTEVGRTLLAEAAHTVVDCSMELGGNAPFLVLDDADLDAAVDGAMVAKMRNGGEACTAANRFYVHERVAEAFSRRLAERMQALPMGPGLRDGVALGPLVNAEAQRAVAGLVDRTVADGARLLTGGSVPAGAGLLLPTDGAGRRTRRCGDPRHRDLRAGGAGGHLRPRRRGGGARQRHGVRPGRLRLHTGSPTWLEDQRTSGGRHGRTQPWSGVRPGGAVRRREAERRRPRGRARGPAGVH